MNIIEIIENEQIRRDIPQFGPGDTVKVHVKVKEGSRERVQVFEGAVIARRGSGSNESFTVRKLSSGIGVERTFPVNSPKIEKIEVARQGSPPRQALLPTRPSGQACQDSRAQAR